MAGADKWWRALADLTPLFFRLARQVKKNYAAANQLLGDIVKVTPSSKVCAATISRAESLFIHASS